ncbi:hypothetical protein UUU_06740 [Klebsiella pneumoniae subsp. pneumoniae DSM 30104 = JCM 1662 = NBRC 14940]|nr:hypothetical protein UUU_06740 [Klebsiella pneumoniae subsp. pneumoniae DSM 30104 = JCM 1662 = NBRC 14940]
MSHHRLLLFLLLRLPATQGPDQQTDNEERARRQQEQAVRLIPAAVLHRLQHRDTEQLAATDKLAQEADDNQDRAIAETVANTIHKARQRRRLHGVGFGAAHHDAVGDDKPDEYRQLFGGLIGESPQQLIHHDHQRGDDRHLHDDAHAIGNMVADHRDKHAGERRHQGHRNGHHEGGFQFGGYRQCGADAQHLQGDGVIGDERPHQHALHLFHIALFSHYSALPHEPFSGTDQSPVRPSRNQSYAVRHWTSAWRRINRQPRGDRLRARRLSPPSAPACRCHPAPACRQTAGASWGFPPRRPAPAFRPDRSK